MREGLVKVLILRRDGVRQHYWVRPDKLPSFIREQQRQGNTVLGMPTPALQMATTPAQPDPQHEQQLHQLLEQLKSRDEWERRAAAWELGELGDPRAVQPLSQTLSQDESPPVRRAAAHALGKLGDPRAVEPLSKAALNNDKHPDVRVAAVEALGKLGDRRAVEPLSKALINDANRSVRAAAAEALGRLGDKRAVDPLIEAMYDEEVTVREAAAIALGELGDPRAVEPLIEALHDNNVYVRAAAAEALGKLGDPRATEPLIDTLRHDEEWTVRAAAAHALAELGDKRAVDPLTLAVFEDADRGVRKAAIKALTTMVFSEGEAWKPAEETLYRLLGSNFDEQLVLAALDTLSAYTGHPRIRGALRELLYDLAKFARSEQVRERARALFQAIPSEETAVS
ncbi:Phycocyanobilin lyase subunit alpha [bacterium HR15]|nr:Phycocyanobilin lyase subunit alpha [bacterium HR15]